jgi:hypothetical protein
MFTSMATHSLAACSSLSLGEVNRQFHHRLSLPTSLFYPSLLNDNNRKFNMIRALLLTLLLAVSTLGFAPSPAFRVGAFYFHFVEAWWKTHVMTHA